MAAGRARRSRRLPGIGPYTARAMASLAFGEPVGVVDTNVRRWLVRRFGLRADTRPVELQTLADALATAGSAADAAPWTHATMEFGAAICASRNPRCDACPIADGCPSRGMAATVPVPRQASFAGSDRAYRGAILRALSGARRHAITMRAAGDLVPARRDRAGRRRPGARWAPASVNRTPRPWRSAGAGRYNRPVSTATAGLKVKIGDQMPSVGLRATDGYLLNLRSLVGKQPVILLFFGGPTAKGVARERGDALAEALKEAFPRLARQGVTVIGVTTDNEQQQAAYVEGARAAVPPLL